MEAVDCRRSGRPDLDVGRSRFGPLSARLSPLGSSRVYPSATKTFKVALRSRGNLVRGSAEKSGFLKRHGQWCVGPSLGLEDPNLPLSIPTGVQLAPTSPKLGD